MKETDLIVGNKYVPIAKTQGATNLEGSKVWRAARAKGQNYLYYVGSNMFDIEPDNTGPKLSGEFFSPEDVVPYETYNKFSPGDTVIITGDCRIPLGRCATVKRLVHQPGLTNAYYELYEVYATHPDECVYVRHTDMEPMAGAYEFELEEDGHFKLGSDLYPGYPNLDPVAIGEFTVPDCVAGKCLVVASRYDVHVYGKTENGDSILVFTKKKKQ